MGPRKDPPTSATSWHRFFGAFLATVYFVQSVLLAASPESNFWSERRRSQTAQRRVLALAALPGSALDATRVTAAWPVPAPESAPIRFSVPPALRQEVARVLEALPAENIRVRGLLVPKGPPAAVLVHLQDVHLNPEAQTNLGQAVSSLAAHRLGDLVALEGVFEGVPLAAYRQRPEREVVRSAADYFLRINKISGPVHALMTAAEPAPVLVGVDDRARYDANVAAYRRSGPVRSAVQKEIADGKAEVAALKSKTFSPALTEFDAVVQRRRDNRAGLGEYAHALNVAAPPELPRASVRAFLQAFAMEKSLDFDAVERERRRLLESLLPRLTAVQTGQLLDWGASYRLGALSAGAFYARLGDLCRERGVALVHFPSMESYLRYVLAADRLRADDLMRELDALETGAYRRLAASPAERALVARDRRLFLAGQLSEFALSPAQWAEWRSGAPTAPDGDARFEPFADFYREAEARDAAMTANVLHAVRDRSARHPVLVTGGFHADSMDRRLADAGWVVVQAAPRLTRVDAAGGSAYLSVFSQERTPLEKLFAGEKLFLTPDPLEGERLMPFAVGAALGAPEAARSLYNAAPRPVSLESIDRTENAPGPGLVADFAGGRRIGFAWRSTASGERSFVQTPVKRGRSVWSAVGAWIAAGWLAASGPATPAVPVAPPPAASAPASVPRAQNVLALLAANRAALTPEETVAVGRLLSMESAMRALNASGEIQVPHRFFEELQSVNAFLRPRQLLLFPNTAPPGFALDPLRILRTSRFYPGVYYVRPLDQYQKIQITGGAEEHGRYALGFTIVHEDANRRAAVNVRRVLDLGDRLPADYQALGIGDIYRTQWPAGEDGTDKIADDLFESAAVHETEHRLNGNERDAILAEMALGPVPRYKMETVNFMYASRFDQKDAHPYFRAVAWMFSRFCEETGKKSVRELSQWIRSATELEIRLLAIKVYVTAKGRPLILDGPAGPAARRGLSEADVARMTQVQNAALPAGTANVDRYASLLARRWFERLGNSPTAFWVRTMARKDAEMFFADKSPVTLADFTAYARMLLAGDDEHLPALANLVFDKAEAMAKAGDAAIGPWVESSFEGFVRFSKESVREVNRERDNPALPHSVPRAVLWAAVFSLAGFFLPGLMGLFIATLDGWMEWAARAPWAWAAYHAGLALGGLGLFRRAAGPPMENAVRAFEEEMLAGVPPSWRDRVRIDVVSGDALRAEARARGAGREAAFFGAVTVRNPDGVVVFVHKNLVSSWGPWEWLGGILRPWIAHHESRRVRHLLTPGRRGGMPLLAVTEPLTFLFRRAELAGISGASAARESEESPRPFGRRAAWWGWAALWASGIFFAVDPAVLQAALPLAVLAGGIRSVSAGARFSTLTVPVNVLDAGSGIRNGRIVTERAVSKIRRLLPDLARAGAGGVYLYNGLYTPSALGARVHTVPTAGDHVIEAGAVKVLVRNYQTKRMIGSARENGRSRAVPLSDAFGNNFSVDMSQWNPAAFEGATNEARWAELADFTADAHRWGLRVTVDLVPWLSPDALNEHNYTWAKDKFEVAGDMAAWSDERLLNHYFDHALLRIEKDGKPARVMVGHFTPGKDQIDPDFSNPDYQRFLIDHLKRLIDAGVDRVRIDMAHRLGTPQKDAVWHAWTKVISEAKAHAAARGRRFQFLMESYPEYGNDQWRSDFLRLYPEEQVYEVDPFHAYEALVRGEGDGLTPLRNALETARRERNGRSVVFPSNYDEPSLRNLGGPKAAFLALLLTYERLGVPLMIDLRELLDEEGHNIPQAGGQDAHGDNFRHPFLRQIRPGFRALRRGMARSPHMDTLSSLRAFFDGAQRVDVLDTQYQNRFFAVGVRSSSGEYKIRVFDFFPERGYARPWVEAPPALLSEDALARREGESETAWEERARSAWTLDGTAGPLPWFVDEDRGVRYRRLPLRFENGTANLTLRPASSPALPHSVLRSVFWSFLFAAGGVAAVVLGPVLGLPSEGVPGLLVFSPFAWAAFHGAMALTVFSLFRPGTAPTPAELRSLESEILAGLRPEESRRVTVRPVTAQKLEAAARSRGAGWESRFFGAAVVREGDRVFVYVNESLAGSWGRWESLGRRLRSLVWFHENRRVRRWLRDNGAGATMPFLPLLEPLLYPFRPRPRAIDPASFLRDLYRPVPGEAQAIIEIHKRVMSVLRPGEFPWPLVFNALVHANHLAGASVEYHENDGFGVEVFNLDDREINGNPDEVVLRDSLLELGRRWVAAGGPSRAADPTPEDLWLLYPIARGLNPRLHSETGAVLERADFRALLRGLGGLEGGPALLRQLDEMNDDGSGLPTWADRGLLMPWETLPDHFGGMEFLSSPVWSEKENGRRRSPSEALSAIYGRPADRPASPVTSPRWSDLYARLIGEAVPEPLTISELFGALGLKYENRRFFDGLIAQPEVVAVLDPDPAELERIRRQGDEPLLTPSIPAFRDPRHRRSPAALADDLLSGRFPLPLIFKSNGASLGMGNIVLQKRGDALSLTMSYAERAGSQRFEQARGAMKVLTDRFPRGAWGQGPVRYRVDAEKSIFEVVIDRSSFADIFVSIVREFSTPSPRSYAVGMVERFSDGVLRPGGKAYETRLLLAGRVGDRAVEWQKEARDYGAFRQPGSFARHGVSGFFAGEGGLEEDLPYARMFEPLAGVVPALGTPPGRAAFEEYVQSEMNRVFEGLGARLLALGVPRGLPLSMEMDLMWLPPVDGKFPRPLLLESKFYPKFGLGNDRERRLEITSRPLDTTAPNSLLYRIVRLTGTVLSRARPGTSLHRVGQWLDRQSPRWGVWGLTGEIPGLMAASLVLGPLGALAGLAAFAVLHLFLEALELHLARGDLGPGRRSLASTFTAVFTRNLRPQFLWFVLAYLPLAHFGPVPAALAWAVLAHLSYDLERMFPAQFRALARDLQSLHGLSAAWMVPPQPGEPTNALARTLATWQRIIDWQIREKNLIRFHRQPVVEGAREAVLRLQPRQYRLAARAALRFTDAEGAEHFVRVKSGVEEGGVEVTVVGDADVIARLPAVGELDANRDPLLPLLRSVLAINLRFHNPAEPYRRLFGLDGAGRETLWGLPAPIDDTPVFHTAEPAEVDALMAAPTVVLKEKGTPATDILSEMIHRLVVDEKKIVLLVGEKDLRDLRELLGAASKKNVPFLCVGPPPADLSMEERRRWLTHLVTDGAEGVTGPIDLSRGLLVASGLINIGLDLPFRRVFFAKDRPDPRLFDAVVFVGLDRYPAVYAQVPIRYAKDHARLIFSGAETDRPARVFRPKNREALRASGFTERDINDYEGNALDWVLRNSSALVARVVPKYADLFAPLEDVAADRDRWIPDADTAEERWGVVQQWLRVDDRRLRDALAAVSSTDFNGPPEAVVRALTDFFARITDGFRFNVKATESMDAAALRRPGPLWEGRAAELKNHLDEMSARTDDLLTLLDQKLEALEADRAGVLIREWIAPVLPPKIMERFVRTAVVRLQTGPWNPDELQSFRHRLETITAATPDPSAPGVTVESLATLIRQLDGLLNGENGARGLNAYFEARIEDAAPTEGGAGELEAIFGTLERAENANIAAWEEVARRAARAADALPMDRLAAEAGTPEEFHRAVLDRVAGAYGATWEGSPEHLRGVVQDRTAPFLYRVGTAARATAVHGGVTPLEPAFAALLAAYNRDLETLGLEANRFYSPGDIHGHYTQLPQRQIRDHDKAHAFGRLLGSRYAAVRKYLRPEGRATLPLFVRGAEALGRWMGARGLVNRETGRPWTAEDMGRLYIRNAWIEGVFLPGIFLAGLNGLEALVPGAREALPSMLWALVPHLTFVLLHYFPRGFAKWLEGKYGVVPATRALVYIGAGYLLGMDFYIYSFSSPFAGWTLLLSGGLWGTALAFHARMARGIARPLEARSYTDAPEDAVRSAWLEAIFRGATQRPEPSAWTPELSAVVERRWPAEAAPLGNAVRAWIKILFPERFKAWERISLDPAPVADRAFLAAVRLRDLNRELLRRGLYATHRAFLTDGQPAVEYDLKKVEEARRFRLNGRDLVLISLAPLAEGRPSAGPSQTHNPPAGLLVAEPGRFRSAAETLVTGPMPVGAPFTEAPALAAAVQRMVRRDLDELFKTPAESAKLDLIASGVRAFFQLRGKLPDGLAVAGDAQWNRELDAMLNFLAAAQAKTYEIVLLSEEAYGYGRDSAFPLLNGIAEGTLPRVDLVYLLMNISSDRTSWEALGDLHREFLGKPMADEPPYLHQIVPLFNRLTTLDTGTLREGVRKVMDRRYGGAAEIARLTRKEADGGTPLSVLYAVARSASRVLSAGPPLLFGRAAGAWLAARARRLGLWGLTIEIPVLLGAVMEWGFAGSFLGLGLFAAAHGFLERAGDRAGPYAALRSAIEPFRRHYGVLLFAYLPLAFAGPIPAAVAWAVLVHVAYDLEKLFPDLFQTLARFLDNGPLLAGAWVVPPGSARVPVTLRSLFVRGYSPEELFAFDQRLPERGPDVFARYHTKAVVVAASRVGGIKSRARAFYAEAPGLGWPPSKIDQIRKAVEAVAALYNPRRVHWFEAEVRGRDGHVLAWPDAFAADVVDFLARRERSLGAPGLVQNYLLSAMLEFKTGLSEFERLEVVGTLVGQSPSAAGEALRRALADFLEEKARAAPAEPAPPAVPAATPAPSERRTLAQWVHAWTGAVESTLFPPADLRGQPGPHEFDFAQTLGENFERPLELDLDHPVDPGVVAGLIGAAIEAENEFFQNVTGELQRALTDLYRWHAGERGVSLYLYVDIAHHQVLIFSPVRSGAKTPGELRPEIRAISFAAGDRVREFTPTRPPVNSIVFSLARAGLWPGFLRRALDPQREMAEWKAGVLGLALEIPALLIAGLAMPSSAFHVGLGLFALAHVFLEARARLLEGRSTSAAWAAALSQLPARLIALAPYAFLPGAPDAAHALAAVLVHLGFDFAVFGRPSVPNDPRDRQFERGLRFPYDEESLSHRFGSFNLSARDRFIGRDGRPGTVYSISLLASPAPDSPVARKIDALAADFLRQPFAAAFFMTPSPQRHLTLRPYVVTPAAPPSQSDWDRFAAAAAAEAARTPPYRYWVRNVGIDANSGRVGVWVDDRLRPDAPRGSIALFSPRRPLTAREARDLRAWVVRHRFDSFGEWNVSELALVQSDDSYFLTRRREKGLTLSAVPVSTTAADHPPALRRLNVRLWAPLAAAPSRGAGTGADIIVRPVSQTGRMVKSYGKAFDRIPAPLAARLEGVRNAMLLGPGSNADEIELLWRRLPHVREIHLVEVVPEYIKAQDDFLVQHPAWWVNADGDPIAYHVWRAPMGALPAELNGSMDFVFDHQVLDFGYLGRLGMESVARSLGRVLRPDGLHLSFIFGSEPALDDYLGTALFRDETVQMALRGAPGLPAIPDARPTGVSAQAEDFRNLVRGTPAPGAVLSLGFGAGDDERYLARQLPDRRVIATTVGEAELRAARARTDTPGNLVYLHEDMRRGFDAAIGSIQHVYARLSLHYLARPELPAVVRELTHVLAPGGILYLVVKGDRDPWTRHPSARRNAANELTSYLDRGQTVYRRFASAADWTREFSEFDYEPLREPVETFERLAGDDHESHLITLVFRRREDRAGRLTEATRFKPRGGRDAGFNVYLKRAAVALAAAAFFATGAPAQTPDPALSLAPLAAPARALVDQGLVKTPEGKKAVDRFAAFIAGGGPGTQRVGNFASLPVRFLEELDRLNDGLAKDQLMVLTRGSAGNTTITPLRRVGPSPLSDQVLRATNIPAETQARGVGGEGGFTVRRLSLIYADRLELKARIVWDVLQLPKGRRSLILPGWDVLIDRQFPMGSAIVSLDAVRSSFEARWVIHEWLHRVGGKERDAILGEFLIAPWLQITTLEVGLMAYAGGPGGESEPARLAAREVFRLLEKELVPGREPPLSAASTLQTLASRGDLDLRRAAIRAWVKAAGRPFFTADTLALARKAGLSSDVLSALQAEEASALPEGTARRAQYENALAKETLAWLTAQGDSPIARRYLRAVALNAPLAPDAPLGPDTVVQLVRRIRGREVDSTFNNALAPLAAERKKLPANSAAAAAHDRGVALATTLLDNLLAQVRRDHQSQALPLSALSAAGAAAMSLVLAVTGIGAFDGPAAFLALLPGAWAFYHGLLLTGALMGRGAAAATDESIRADAAARFRRYLPRTPVHFNFEEDFDALPAGVRVSFVPRAEVVARARKALETRPGEQALARFYAAVTLPRSDGGLDVLLSEDLVRPAPRFLRPLWAAARRLVLFHEARRVRSLSSVRGPRGPWTVMEPLDFVGSALRDRWTRPASAVPSPAVPGPSALGEDLGRAAARRAPAGFDGRSILDALDRMVPVASQRVEDLGASAPAADLAAQRDEFVEAFRRQWAAETERPLSLGEARRSLAAALVQSRFESPVEIFQTREDLLRDHLVIVPPTYTPPELTAYVDAAVRASRGRRIVFAVPKGDDFQKTKRELFRIARRVRTAPNVAVFALPDGSMVAEDGLVLRLGVVARGLGAVAPSLITVPRSFSIDTSNLPDGPYRTAVFLLIDALLQAVPLRLSDLETIDRTARAVATSA